jgi:hypothetical protein
VSRPAFALGAVPAALWFTLHAAPSVTYRDAGELTAAAFLLDVPHPTGFPVDMLAVRLAMLVPIGDVAFRASLAVAALTALACGCASHLTYRLLPALAPPVRLGLAALPAAALMASSTVLRAATAMEVYAGSLLLALAALASIDPADRAPSRRRVAALALGLSLAMHVTARPAALLAVALAAWPDPWPRRARALVPIAALALVAAAVLVYLPLAARRGGPIDWGDPQTLGRWVDHLTSRTIRAAYAHRILVPWRAPEDLAAAGRVLVEDLGAPLVLLGVAGALMAARRRAAWPMLAVTLADLAYTVLINPMGTVDRQTLFVTEAGLAVLASLALGALAARVARWELPTLGAAALAVAVRARCDARWGGAADGWAASELLGGAGALGAAPARAVVLCASDDACGGAMFAQWVEGERPDVTVLPQGFLDDPPTWRRLEPRRALLRGAAVPAAQRLAWLVARGGERVRWEGDGRDVPWIPLAPGETPVFARVGAAATADDGAAARAWVRAHAPGDGVGARRIGAMVLFAEGVRRARGDALRGAPWWRAALGLWPDHAAAWTNLGVLAARAGDLRGAVAMTRRGLDLQPERPRAWRNLADYLAAAGDGAGAAEARREAARR